MAKNKNAAYRKLTSELIQEIVTCVVIAVREEDESRIKERYDRKRSNTRMLLRNYRSLCDHSKSAIYELSQANDYDLGLDDILELMGARDSIQLESIKTSAAKTKAIIAHVDLMLELYKSYCKKSKKPEEMRRYRTIKDMYLAAVPKSAEEIAEKESVDVRTTYKDISAAIERLTALIFGIDGLHLLKK